MNKLLLVLLAFSTVFAPIKTQAIENSVLKTATNFVIKHPIQSAAGALLVANAITEGKNSVLAYSFRAVRGTCETVSQLVSTKALLSAAVAGGAYVAYNKLK